MRGQVLNLEFSFSYALTILTSEGPRSLAPAGDFGHGAAEIDAQGAGHGAKIAAHNSRFKT